MVPVEARTLLYLLCIYFAGSVFGHINIRQRWGVRKRSGPSTKGPAPILRSAGIAVSHPAYWLDQGSVLALHARAGCHWLASAFPCRFLQHGTVGNVSRGFVAGKGVSTTETVRLPVDCWQTAIAPYGRIFSTR